MGNSTTIVVRRCEKKFAIGMEDRVRLLHVFHTLLTPDVYGGEFGYTVRSIYFDTRNNNDFYDKIYKARVRKTLRLRTYDSGSSVTKFEIKFKRGDNQVKKSVTIAKEDAQALINQEWEVLLKYDNPTAFHGYQILKAGFYRPVSFIQYDRRAFTHRDFNTRLTLDNHVLFSNEFFDLFNPELDLCIPVMTNNSVLEVKYENFLLPYLQDLILSCEFIGKPISKFGTSRQIVKRFYC